jgi:hypothetical protein
MSTQFDVRELAREIAKLEAQHERGKVVVVVPLVEGGKELAREFLAEGPPFDPKAIGLKSHEVFVTEDEAVFVFEAPDVRRLEQILAESELWSVVSVWEDIAAGPPRIAEVVYDWSDT